MKLKARINWGMEGGSENGKFARSSAISLKSLRAVAKDRF
jgi:hypothetical protein